MRLSLAAVVVFAGMTLAANGAFAKEGDKSVEATLNYGTESFDGLDGQFGATVGFGYEVRDRLQGRFDVSYFRSSKDQAGMNVGGTRVPVDLGARYYYPLTRVDANLSAFGQGGIEISFDSWEPDNMSDSRSRTSFGAVIGGGVEYMLDRQFGATANVLIHAIEGSYLSTGVGMAYHF